MKDEYGRINNRAQAIRSFDNLRLAYLMKDVLENPNKYPQNINDWLEWLNADSGDSVDNL